MRRRRATVRPIDGHRVLVLRGDGSGNVLRGTLLGYERIARGIRSPVICLDGTGERVHGHEVWWADA